MSKSCDTHKCISCRRRPDVARASLPSASPSPLLLLGMSAGGPANVPMGVPVLGQQDSQDDSVQTGTLGSRQLADIDFSDEFVAKARMFEAAFQGRWAYVKAYLDHDQAWVNIDNPLGSRTGYKLVHQAAHYGSSLPVLLMLAQKGANFLETTNAGETPVQIATSRSKTKCASNIGGIVDGSIGQDGTPLKYLCPITQAPPRACTPPLPTTYVARSRCLLPGGAGLHEQSGGLGNRSHLRACRHRVMVCGEPQQPPDWSDPRRPHVDAPAGAAG